MDYQIVKRFYSNVKANIYLLKLQEKGVTCFLSSENISTILPLSDGGTILNVAVDEVETALKLINEIESEEVVQVDEDYADADKEDIKYAQKVNEYEKWLEGGWLDMNTVSSILFVLFIIVVLGIVINYFIPFK